MSNAATCRTDKLEPLGEALAIIDFAKAQAAQRARHLQHPQFCLDAIRYGVEHGGLAGLKKVQMGSVKAYGREPQACCVTTGLPGTC